MPRFHYRALTAAGEVVAGVLEAPSPADVVQHLRSLGHFPIATNAAGRGDWRGWLTRDIQLSGPSLRDHSIVVQELATLLHAGLPLDRAVEILAGLGETKRLRASLFGVLARVRDGVGLADAMAADPVFPKLAVSMVRAGEMGGNLEDALRRLGDYLQKAHAIRETIVSALVYPAMLLITAGLSLLVILVFVLPEFEPLFRSAGKSLPLSTRVVMGVGTVIGSYWWALALVAIGGVVAWRQAMKQPTFRRRWDARLLRLPLFGGLLTKIQVERFSRTLGTLVANGVALPTALGITRDTLSNSVVAEVVGETAVGLREGEALADRLARAQLFPDITIDLVRVGEETGTLDEMLIRQADLTERSIKHTVDRMLATLVPALTIVLGILIAGLIASMLSAVISVDDLATK